MYSDAIELCDMIYPWVDLFEKYDVWSGQVCNMVYKVGQLSTVMYKVGQVGDAIYKVGQMGNVIY